MTGLEIHLVGDGAWPDLKDKVSQGRVIKTTLRGIAALPGGVQSGRSSVALRIDLPDGRVVFAETTMRLFLNAANAFKIRYGAELDGDA